MTDCCNPNSILVQDNNGCGASGLSLTPCINLTTGTYYVLVESDPNDNFQCSNEFTLTVTPCNNPCPAVDSLTITPFEESSVFLNFYLPTPGFVRFYLSTNKTSEFPTGFNLIDSFRANTAGRYDHYEIFAPGAYGRYVATLDSCGP